MKSKLMSQNDLLQRELNALAIVDHSIQSDKETYEDENSSVLDLLTS